MEDLVSVIIPTYKRANMLPRAIKSVLSQSHKSIEIIVVDDNGLGTAQQTETESLLKKYKNLENFRYLPNKTNLGGGLSRNSGIEKAAGKYITFLDDDDEYLADKVKKQLNFYKRKFPNDDGFINCQMRVLRNKKVLRKTKRNIDLKNLLFEAVNEKILGTPTLFLPKALLLHVGGFSKIKKGQEWHLSVKLVDAGIKFLSMKECLVDVHVHDFGSISNISTSNEKSIEGYKQIYAIQKTFFPRFTNEQQAEIQSKYFHNIAVANLAGNIMLSIRFFFSSLSKKIIAMHHIRYIFKLLMRALGK